MMWKQALVSTFFILFQCKAQINFARPPVQLPFRNQPNRILTYYFTLSTYQQALVQCLNAGTNLLIIDSPGVQTEALRELEDEIGILDGAISNFSPSIEAGYWIAGNDSRVEGIWTWRDGRRIPTDRITPYQNWYIEDGFNEPFRSGSENRDCLFMSGLANSEQNPNILGKWLSSNCNFRKYFICDGFRTQGPCDINPCNGGTCIVNFNGGFTCQCPNGFTGRTCQNIVDPCISNPCGNGFCNSELQNGIRVASCFCFSGYTGQFCDITLPSSTNRPPITAFPPYDVCCRVPLIRRVPCGDSRESESTCRFVNGCCFDRVRNTCYNPIDTFLCRPTPDTPGWYFWSGWSICTRTCGNGLRTRTRLCRNGAPGGVACPGSREEVENCSLRSC